MKIAIVLLWSPPFLNKMTGGAIHASRYLARNISTASRRDTVELISTAPKARSGMDSAFTYIGDMLPDKYLNANFDFVIFSNAGQGFKGDHGLTPFIDHMLNGLDVPFAVQMHSEREPSDLRYSFPRFITHKRFSLAMPINDTVDAAVRWGPVRRIEYHCGPDVIQRLDVEQPTTPRIITTARYTSVKRLLELAQQSEALRIPVEMYGADVNYWYFNAVKSHEGNYLKCYGAYKAEDLKAIFARGRWHYNCTSMARFPFKRVELATTEAVAHGLIPILHHEAIPAWVTPDIAILVDPKAIDSKAILDSPVQSSARFIDAYNAIHSMKTKRLLKEIKSCTAS